MRVLPFIAVLCSGWVLLGCALNSSVSLKSQVNFAPPTPASPEPLLTEAKAIAQALARGGYVIYLRHGRTVYGQIERELADRKNGSLDYTKCDTQRLLSDEGRAELRTAGQQFRLTGVRLDKIYSSRYCRAIESAQYFVDTAVPTDALSGEGEVGLNLAQKPRTVAFLSAPPAPGRNHFMMAHGGIFWEATGFTVQEGHAVVLDPTNLRVIVARIAPAEWGQIALAWPPP
jgi:hypothetical protein